MRKFYIVFSLLVSQVGFSQLMPTASPLYDVYPGEGNAANLSARGGLQIDADFVTGRWTMCFWLPPVANEMRCQIYADSNNTSPIANLQFGNLASTRYPDIIDLQMTEDGGFYLMFVDNFGDLYAFRIDGTTFNVTTFPFINLLADSMGIAPHANGHWIGGSLRQSTSINAFAYDLSGNYIDHLVFEVAPSGKNYCGASIRSNVSGDIMIAWVERDQNDLVCRGNIRAKVWRPDGTSVSNLIQLDMPSGVTGSTPQVEVDNSGVFVIAWSGSNNLAYSAKFSVPQGLVQAVSSMNIGVEAKVGSGSYGKDYVVMTRNNNNGNCEYNIQLADSGTISPVIRNSNLDSCEFVFPFAHDIDVLKDGRIVIAWIVEKNNTDEQVLSQIYHHPVTAIIGGISLSEGDPNTSSPIATATVVLSHPHPTNQNISMNYYTRSDTAIENVDYVGVNGTLMIPPGDNQGTINIPFIADTLYEDNEIFQINIDFPTNTAIRVATDNIIILNDDISPPLTDDCDMNFPDPCRTVAEPQINNTSEMVVSLNLNQIRERDIYIDFETVDETATAGNDYVATSGTLHIPAGSSGGDISILILPDVDVEATETFLLELSSTASVVIPNPELRFAITEGPACLLTLDPTGSVFEHIGGNGSFDMVFTHPSCVWSIIDVPLWVTVTSPLTGVGDTTVEFMVDSQSGVGMFPRIDSIIVETGPPLIQQSYDVEQQGDASLCDFVVDPVISSVAVEGGSKDIQISADQACPWEVFSDDDWVQIQSPISATNGDAVLSVTIDPNQSTPNQATLPRTALLDAPFLIEIQQAGCAYDLPVNQVSLDQSGGQTTVTIHAPTIDQGPCQWTAQSNQAWIIILNGHSGSGGGAVLLDVLENPSIQSRTGTVTIGNQVFVVNQQGIACNYELTPNALEFCPDGSSDSTQIQTANGCDWSFSDLPQWLQIDFNQNGVGIQSTQFTSQENSTENTQQGTVFLDSSAQNNVSVLAVSQLGYLVLEDFNQISLPMDWNYLPNTEFWGINNQQLSATFSTTGTGMAFDMTDSSYCSDCKIEAQVKLTYLGGSNALIGVLAWYQDENTHVSFQMDEISNQWILTYTKNGVADTIVSNNIDILPFQTYQLALSWDQGFIYASVDDSLVLQLPINESIEAGRSGFIAQNTNAEFDRLRVIGVSSSLDNIFKGDFEILELVLRSTCSL